MTRTELMQAIIQKQDELIKKYAEYSRFLLRHGISNCGAWIIMKDQLDNDLNEMLFELSELKKQLEECEKKDYSHLCCICHENYVDSDNGIDTCDSCMNRI
jgi:hypothetical protein